MNVPLPRATSVPSGVLSTASANMRPVDEVTVPVDVSVGTFAGTTTFVMYEVKLMVTTKCVGFNDCAAKKAASSRSLK